MKFSIIQNGMNPIGDSVTRKIISEFISHGHAFQEKSDDIQFVLNLTSMDTPNIFHRRSKAVFVITLVIKTCPDDSLRAACYQTLIRSLKR